MKDRLIKNIEKTFAIDDIKFVGCNLKETLEFCFLYQDQEYTIPLALGGFFRKRKKKGFVYIGKLDSPIYHDSKGVVWVDGKQELKRFDECSQRLKDWLSFIVGRPATNEDYIEFIKNEPQRDLNPFDFEYYDIYDIFLNELSNNVYSLRNNWVLYYKRYNKLHTEILQNYAKKLFKGLFSEFSPIVNFDFVNYIDKLDAEKRIFFINRKGKRIRVNSPHLMGVIYDPVGTAEGSLINQKNRMPINSEIRDGQFYINGMSLREFYSSPVKFLDGDVRVWNQKTHKEPVYEQTYKDILSVVSSTIPMINYCDTTRAILSAHMLCQAVPLVNGAPAIIYTDPSYFDREYEKKLNYIVSLKGTYNFFTALPDTFSMSKEPRLSTPLLTAYMSFGGYEEEDSIILSESAAYKLSVYRSERVQGDLNDIPLDVIDIEIYGDLSDIPRGYKKYYRGPGDEVIFTKRYDYPVQLGDKITTRYGCKGVVSLILPDSDMPKVGGRTIEAIMSPLAVLNRKNIAQYYECLLTNALWYGRDKIEGDRHENGIPRLQLDPIESRINPAYLDEFLKRYQAPYYYEIDGKQVIVGYNEFMRLYFFSDKKFFYYGDEKTGGNHERFRVDEMALWALFAHDDIDIINTEYNIKKRREWLANQLAMAGYVSDILQ